MKHIHKDPKREPDALRVFRESTPNARFDGLHGDEKQVLRAALAEEQGFICAYCMGRIRPDAKHMEVEHFISQKHHPDSPHSPETHRENELRYQNLLGTCAGNRACSNIRGNAPLTIDPRNADCERLVRFLKNGIAYSGDPNVQNDIAALRLNDIADARSQVIDKARADLEKIAPNKTWSNALLDKQIEAWKTRKYTRHGSAFEPYCMAAVHYLESKKN
jgi:uncharacterized protein (TIGR02646 family)